MAEEYPTTSPVSENSAITADGRRAEVRVLASLRDAHSSGLSLSEFAETQGIPESTVRHWVARSQSCGAPPSFVRFVESPEGLEVLHVIVLAASFVITQVIGGGVRAVCMFLELSGLWRVVAAGYGTQQVAVKRMEEAIVTFGTAARAEAAPKMAAREITLTQDETFHERPCLVAVEPVSNFILVEQYAEDRCAKTWTAAVEKALAGLPVKVIQSTSDEGSALLRAARLSEAHHSPDLFHPQQDISRATSLPLERKVTTAQEAVSEAAAHVEELRSEAARRASEPRGPGRPRNFDKLIAGAESALAATEASLAEAQARREQVRQAARAISRAYHPVDLETGALRDAPEVQADIAKQFGIIDRVAAEVSLGGRCLALLEKARRVVPQMVATIAFVHTLIRQKIEGLDLDPAAEQVFQRQLIPACYLEEVVRKAPTADDRAALRARAAELRAGLDAPQCPLRTLPADERQHLGLVARECAQLFQRSSSNVEGRNGVLALRHHSIHRLPPRKLQALTVVHNYATRRADGTTPAERFFGHRHSDLFEHLVAKMPPPKRPAARRNAVS